MSLKVDLVDGTSFVAEASTILEQAWTVPSICYTPAYLRWQLSFPSAQRLPSVAAFDGDEPVGFAGVSGRRMRHGASQRDYGVVSFVAVRPQWRKRGIARELYRKLVAALRDVNIRVLTFGVPDSIGDLTLLNAYSEAKYSVRPIGVYRNYGFLARRDPLASAWDAEEATTAGLLPGIISACARNIGLIWSDPDGAQVEHYRADPRPRKLVILRRHSTGSIGAAWIVQGEYRGPLGAGPVTTVDSIWMPEPDVAALPALFHFAARAWPEQGGMPVVISAPNLAGFDATAFRGIGLRETGGRFQGYLCTPNAGDALPACNATNMEIV
jgi:ribosomal protein S18 acetylase RimI-like enzyme